MLVHLNAAKVPAQPARHAVTFTKQELNAILSIYSFQVSKGSWRDYAVDFTRDMALFSMYRRTSEQPVVSVAKYIANTSTGFVFEVFYERKRLSRTPDLTKALSSLQDSLID